MVADVKKFLITSKLLKLLANDPTDLGYIDIFKFIAFSKISDDIIISLFFPAISRRYALIFFKIKSITRTRTIPTVNPHKVSWALLGITLS